MKRKRLAIGQAEPPRENRRADFHVSNHGSIFLVEPLNEGAEHWASEHFPNEKFGKAYPVEHRYISEIVRDLVDNGFVVI